MKSYIILFFALCFVVSGDAVAQAQEKLHGAAKHHRSPDAQTSHKGEKHEAPEAKKPEAAKPVAVKPKKQEPAKKAVEKPAVVKHVAAPKPVQPRFAAKKPSVKHVADIKPVVAHHKEAVHLKAAHHTQPHIVTRKVTHKPPVVVAQEIITLNQHTPTTEVEIRNGNVLVNDSFVFKIKSLSHEDDKITLVNAVAPAMAGRNANSEENDEMDDNAGGAMLGVFTSDAPRGGAGIESVVPGSPADEAGLDEGDVITKLDGAAIDNSQSLVEAVKSHKPGDKVMITWWHCGRKEITCLILADAGEKEKCEHHEEYQPAGYYRHFCHGRWR